MSEMPRIWWSPSEREWFTPEGWGFNVAPSGCFASELPTDAVELTVAAEETGEADDWTNLDHGGPLYQLMLRWFEEPLNRDSPRSAADTAMSAVYRQRRALADNARLRSAEDGAADMAQLETDLAAALTVNELMLAALGGSFTVSAEEMAKPADGEYAVRMTVHDDRAVTLRLPEADR